MTLKIGDYVAIEIGKIIGFTSDGKAVVEFPSFADDLTAYNTEELFLFSSEIDPDLKPYSPESSEEEEFIQAHRDKWYAKNQKAADL